MLSVSNKGVVKMAKNYDVVVLGGGTGGYVAAIRAAQLGLSVAIVEKEKLGGTCLHKGCIPTKSLLRSAEVYRLTKSADRFGVHVDGAVARFGEMQARKDRIVEQLHRGVQSLMQKNKIDVYKGKGYILGPSIFSPLPGTISVDIGNGEENEMLIPSNVIIATGSSPRAHAELKFDGKRIVSSDDLLMMERLPDRIAIVGGGVIGIEWASLLTDLGVEVTVIEFGPTILPQEDIEIAQEMMKSLKKRGVRFFENTEVGANNVNVTEEAVQVSIGKEALSFDQMLIAIGRTANTHNIGLENTDVVVEDGFIQVNERCQTKESHIYAIGDVIGGLQLAHVASHEGMIAVEAIAGNVPEELNPQLIPKCVYSYPEIASVGLTEKAASELGKTVQVCKFPFAAIGKAVVYGETEGFIKYVVDRETEDILGIHLIGPHATDLISEGMLAIVLNAVPWEISGTVHPHPSLSEIFGEGALAVEKRAIHF